MNTLGMARSRASWRAISPTIREGYWIYTRMCSKNDPERAPLAGAVRYGAGLETVVAAPRTPRRAPRLDRWDRLSGRGRGIPLPIPGLDEGQDLLDEGRSIGLGHERSDLIELARDRLGEGEGIGRVGIGLERQALGIADIGGDATRLAGTFRP